MIVAIIQARMGSSRLPGKVLADIGGQTMLFRVVERVRQARTIGKVVVATTDLPEDDQVARFCEEAAIPCFRGSAIDVLDRYYQAAKALHAENIVRITADCPLIDPVVVDRVVHAYLGQAECEYATNTMQYTYPDGLDTEVFSFRALEEAWQQAKNPLEREHVTPYIRTIGVARKNGHSLLQVSHEGGDIPAGLRWTVDEAADLEFVRAVYARLAQQGGKGFGLHDILALLAADPALRQINAGIGRNEGFYKSLLAESPMPGRRLDLAVSHRYQKKGEALIPSTTQTLSKGPTQFTQPLAPVYLERGENAHVWDVDGNEFVDCILGLGPVILGYNHPAVQAAVAGQLARGSSFSLPHRLEVETAELLTELIPCAEMVRFGKNGSDVTAGAVRAARACTGRDIVACCGYHGWQDWYVGTTTRNKGVPRAVRELTVPFAYNDLASLERIFTVHPGRVAAVIMEPISVEAPRDNFLHAVRELAHRHGALLIFDEVITGFRLALGGAQEYLGVTPDLACFGKALANGFPLSAVVGRREVMQVFDEVFFSFTFGGEALSLAAARATMEVFQREAVIAALWEHGGRLQEGFNVLARELNLSPYLACVGLPPRTVVQIRHPEHDPLILKSILQQEMLERGVLWAGYHNVCLAMTEADILHILRAYRAALPVVREAIDSGRPREFLRGRQVKDVFRKV